MERHEKRIFFGPSGNKPKGARRTSEAKLHLSNAYRAIFFTNNATDQQREMVLVHLAEISGFYTVKPPGLSADERAYHEGARSVFGMIVSNTSMTPDERVSLEQASRHEAFVSQVEGEL
jgi:hypothetical protein